MKYHVQWTVKAEQDVEHVLQWFHEQSASTAGARWVAQLMARINPRKAARTLRAGNGGQAIGLGDS